MMKKGFTLVELLVAILLFSLTIGGAVSMAVSLINREKNALAAQNLANNGSYFLEYSSRFLRMAQKDDGGCITASKNYSSTGSSIRFLDYENYCREFLLDGNQIKEKVSTDDTSANFGTATAITSQETKVNALTFTVNGDGADSQPRVTISLSLQDLNLPEVTMEVETTISQRNLNL
jgi:prepilin-type N-terminal cleavage/methylation domain-containing protein